MQLISAHDGKLLRLDAVSARAAGRQGFVTGLEAWDALLPAGGFARGAVHELLTERGEGKAMLAAMMLAKGTTCETRIGTEAQRHGGTEEREDDCTLKNENYKLKIEDAGKAISPSARFSIFNFQLAISNPSPPSPLLIWSDPHHQLYPPTLAAHGISLENVFLLHPKTPQEENWAIAECLGCKGVGAVVAAPASLTRTEARRLQLAAERGGGVGILMRDANASPHYAAATRWLVRPAPGERTLQRWNIQFIHGHGGRIGQTLCLEHCRETNRLRVFEPVAHRQDQPKPSVAKAS